MITNEVSDGLAGILRTASWNSSGVTARSSARQLGVFLTCYLETEAQTVRGLAAKLGVSKPAITRALDRLSEFDLVRRKTDPLDRRSVLVQRTATGMAFLRECGRSFVMPRSTFGSPPNLPAAAAHGQRTGRVPPIERPGRIRPRTGPDSAAYSTGSVRADMPRISSSGCRLGGHGAAT